MTLDGGDLVPLEGHRRLSSLDLRTTGGAVDIAPLAGVPRLRGLDLSGADVSDLTVLAGLPELRYLALNTQQWAVLSDREVMPPALAAARLPEDSTTFDQALAWSARLGLDTRHALRVTGTL